MANEFIARNGLISQNNSTVTGSLTVTAGITGSFSGSGADLYDIPASGIIGLNLSQISSGSVSASISENNGFQVNTNVVATSFTGSLFGTASYALSSSLSATASFARYPFITITTVGATAAGSSPNTDYIYLVNGSHTVTLPTAVGNTSRYDIKNIGTGIATIATTSAQTIDTTTAPITIPVRYTALTIVSNGTNWNII